jgi:hypothetical protein
MMVQIDWLALAIVAALAFGVLIVVAVVAGNMRRKK